MTQCDGHLFLQILASYVSVSSTIFALLLNVKRSASYMASQRLHVISMMWCESLDKVELEFRERYHDHRGKNWKQHQLCKVKGKYTFEPNV